MSPPMFGVAFSLLEALVLVVVFIDEIGIVDENGTSA